MNQPPDQEYPTFEELTQQIQDQLDAMQQDLEDEMTEAIGRPLAKALLYVMDFVATAHLYVERKLGR